MTVHILIPTPNITLAVASGSARVSFDFHMYRYNESTSKDRHCVVRNFFLKLLKKNNSVIQDICVTLTFYAAHATKALGFVLLRKVIFFYNKYYSDIIY